MPDLTPAEQIARAEAPLVVPSPPRPGDMEDLASLTADEIQARIAAREKDIRYHIRALKQEVTTIGEDVNVGGRPLMDRIREQPLLVVGAAAAGAAALGLLSGWLKRRARRPEPEDAFDLARLRLQHVLDEAAARVQRGDSPERALQRSLGGAPLIYAPTVGKAAEEQAKSSTRQVLDVGIKTLFGFAVKAGTDQLTQALTGKQETLSALADAAD